MELTICGSRTSCSFVAMNPLNTIFDAKRLIGRAFDDAEVQRDIKHWPFEVIRGDNNNPLVRVVYRGEEHILRPEEISAAVLTKMKQTAEDYLGKEVRKAVVTVPAYFNGMFKVLLINPLFLVCSVFRVL